MMLREHPTSTDLIAYSSDSASVEVTATIRDHITGCSECAMFIAHDVPNSENSPEI
jgi:hypothetical protein